MNNYKKNLKILSENYVYSKEMEHDACGVGVIVSTEGKKSREIVEYGIEALKAVWHRGAVDADGKTGDGAGIHVEIPKDFFIEKIEVTGHDYDNSEICVGMIFLPRNDYSSQEKCKTIIENELLNENYYVYRWRQVPVNTKVLGIKAESNRPEIVQIIFKSNNNNLKGDELERFKKAREELLEQRDKTWEKSVLTDEYMPKRPSRKDISALYRKGVQVIGRAEQRLFNTVLGCVVLGTLVFCSIVFGFTQTIEVFFSVVGLIAICCLFIYPFLQIIFFLSKKIWRTRKHEVWDFFKIKSNKKRK